MVYFLIDCVKFCNIGFLRFLILKINIVFEGNVFLEKIRNFYNKIMKYLNIVSKICLILNLKLFLSYKMNELLESD